MSDSDEQATRRLRERAAGRPDESTVALGAAGGLVQSWDAVPLTGEDAPPAGDPATAMLRTVRAPGTATVREPAADGGPDTPAGAWPAPLEPGATATAGTTERWPPPHTHGPAAAAPTADAWPDRPAGEVPTRRLPADPRDAPPPAGNLLRFGPGVPAPGTEQAAAVWRGGSAAPARPRRRRGGYVLVALVLLAVLGLLLWRRSGPALAVDGVAVAAASRTVGCDGTGRVTATVRVHGGAGTLRYRWTRSDGTASGPFTQDVAAGSRTVLLPLRWTFHGHGGYRATATVSVDTPERRSASATFTYACPR